MTYKEIEIGNSPTLEMVEEYIKSHGFDLDPKAVYDMYAKRGFTTKKHQPLKSVEAMVNAQNGIVVSKKRKATCKSQQEIHIQIVPIVHTYGRYDGNTGTGRWGYKIKYPNGNEKIERGVEANTYSTAFRMELTAINEALNNFGLYSRIEIVVESDYAKEVIDHNDNAIFYPKNQDIIKDIYYKLNGSAMMYTVKVKK